MTKRALAAGLCAILFPYAAQAQQSTIPKIGVLTLGVPASSPHTKAFLDGLKEHGYLAGRDVAVEYRFADGRAERLPGLASELVKLKVSVIVTESTPAAQAASAVTNTIPIVMAVGNDPIAAGLAASLARPGGNFTGVTLAGANRTAKQLQLVKEVLPDARSVAVVYNAGRRGVEAELKEATETARASGLVVSMIGVTGPDRLMEALESVAKARPSALITVGDGMLLGSSKHIAEFSVKARLPAVFPEREFADAGGLMAYGPDIGWNFRRSAWYVQRILRGAKPADLPIEQPTKWGLVVNLRTAKSLGLTIPGSVLVRADEVIQ